MSERDEFEDMHLPFDPINEPKEDAPHQSQLPPEENKFHKGNGDDGKHYWLTPPELYAELDEEFCFDFDPCPFPKPEDFDGLTCEWGDSSYVNPPFGSIMHEGKKKGPTAWARKAIAENRKGKSVVLVYPMDKWVLMLLEAGAKVRNLGDVRWLATEDGSQGKGTGRHIACFVLEPEVAAPQPFLWPNKGVGQYFQARYRRPGGEWSSWEHVSAGRTDHEIELRVVPSLEDAIAANRRYQD